VSIDVAKHYIGRLGPVGRLTLLAGTTSATRRGPDHNRPTRRAFFLKTGRTRRKPVLGLLTLTVPMRRDPGPIWPTRRAIFLKTGLQGPCRPVD